MTSEQIRAQLVDALRLDLVGPQGTLGTPDEVLDQSPSRWYLTGFLVPIDSDESDRSSPDSAEPLDSGGEAGGADDGDAPDTGPARPSYLLSSIGLSVLVGPAVPTISPSIDFFMVPRATGA